MKNENPEKALPNFPTLVSHTASVLGLVALETSDCAHGHGAGPQFVDLALGGPITEFLMFRNTL